MRSYSLAPSEVLVFSRLPEHESESFQPAMAPVRGGGGGGGGNHRSERTRGISIKNLTQHICKKASKLSTLCDDDLALVCYPPGPAIWPSDRSKVEEAIRHYVDAPANKKLPKNQITVHDPNPGTDKSEGTGKKVVAKAEKADRIRIPFHDDEDKAIRRYVDASANKKQLKNQITLHDLNLGTDKSEDAGKKVVAKAEKADRIRIPFHDDEDKLRELEGILESRIAELQKMIAFRRMDRRRDPRPSARDSGKKLARGKAALPLTLEAAAGMGGAPNFLH